MHPQIFFNAGKSGSGCPGQSVHFLPLNDGERPQDAIERAATRLNKGGRLRRCEPRLMLFHKQGTSATTVDSFTHNFDSINYTKVFDKNELVVYRYRTVIAGGLCK